jgi:cytochrome c biogenesis protein
VAPDLDFSVGLKGFADYTLIIAKKDPGQGIVWTAFLLLIIGLAITFYLPRRRIWARIARSGELRIVARSDRYVDLEREFGRLLDDLVARRSAADRAGPPLPA